MNSLSISCNALSKSFSGKSIFKNINLTVASGESLAVIGKNGSGKSTLLKILSNLISQTSGEVTYFENETMIPKDRWFTKTGFLAPYLNLYDEFTGIENLMFFYEFKNGKSNNTLETVSCALQKTGMFEKRNETVKNYSSGMKQRLKLAFAIMNDPGILILDEPGTNLDSEGTELLHNICSEHKKKGVLIIAANDESDIRLCENTLNIENYT